MKTTTIKVMEIGSINIKDLETKTLVLIKNKVNMKIVNNKTEFIYKTTVVLLQISEYLDVDSFINDKKFRTFNVFTGKFNSNFKEIHLLPLETIKDKVLLTNFCKTNDISLRKNYKYYKLLAV